jgi:two-component system, OmpR family, response regulator
MRLLVAEDDPAIAEGLLQSLRSAGYAVEWVEDGERAEAALAAAEFDLLILDLGLPKKSGLEVLKGLRLRASRLPVLILTALDDLSHRVHGLDAGADDYLRKPFEFAELEARVRALTRRGNPERPAMISLGGLAYDRNTRVARLNGAPLDLTTREVMLLEILLRRAGHLVSRDQLAAQLGEWGEEISSSAIEVYVHRLRKRLELGGIAIVSVPALGYSLEKLAGNGEPP